MFKKNGIIFRDFSIKGFNDKLKIIKDKILVPNNLIPNIDEKDKKIFIFIIKYFGVEMIYNLNFISKKNIRLIINKPFSQKTLANQLSLLFMFIYAQNKNDKIINEEDIDIFGRYFKLFYINLYNLIDNISNAKYKDNNNIKTNLEISDIYGIIRLNLLLSLNDLINKSFIFNESIHYLVKFFFANENNLITQTNLNLILTQICANLLNSDLNLYFLRRDKNLDNFSILEITKFLNSFQIGNNLNGLIEEILSLIYTNNYSSLINDYILNHIKKCFFELKKNNINNIMICIKSLLGLVKFLNILFEKEQNDKMDPYRPSSFFIFGKNKYSGINYNANNELLKKNFTLIFSFKINGFKDNVIYPLISYVSNIGKNEIIFNISIYNEKVQLYCQGDTEFQEIEEISANKSYLIIIEYKSMGILKDKFKICINGKKKEINSGNINYKTRCSLKIGYIPEDIISNSNNLFQYVKYFDGIIGPIIQFSSTFDDKNFLKNVFKLKRNYDILLLMNNNANLDYFYNYEEYLFYLSYDINSAKNYFNDISKKINEDFQFSICPTSMINNINHNTLLFYQDIYGKNVKVNNKEVFTDFNTLSIPSSKSLATYAKKDQKSLSVFVEYDGIHLYILIVEYFYNILRMLINNPKEEKIEIVNEMNNVLSYIIKSIFKILAFFNLENFHEAIDTFGFSIKKLFSLLIDIQPLNEILVDSISDAGKPLLIHIKKLVENPSSKLISNFLTKFTSLIFSNKYLDILNYSKPENIFEFINLALKNNHELINKNILIELLSFSFILDPVSFYNSNNQSEQNTNSVIKDYIKIRKEYKSLIANFIKYANNLKLYVNYFQIIFNHNSKWNEKYELVKIFYKNHKVKTMYNVKENKDSNKFLLNIFKKDKNNKKDIIWEKELFNEYKKIFSKLVEISPLIDKKNETSFELLKSLFILLIYEHKITIPLNIFNDNNKESLNTQEKKIENKRATIKSEDNHNEEISFFSSYALEQMKRKSINSLNSSPNLAKLVKSEEIEMSNDEFILDFSCEDKEDMSQSFELIDKKSNINYLFDVFLISKNYSFFAIKAIFSCLCDNLDKESKIKFIKNKENQLGPLNIYFGKINRFKKELFSQMLSLIEFISNENILQESLKLIYSFIDDCILKYTSNLSNKNIQALFLHLLESTSIIKKLFHFSLNNEIITNQEFKNYIISRIKFINNSALLYHPRPYIFSLIKSCFKSGYSETFLLFDNFCKSIIDFLKLDNCKLKLLPFYNSVHFIKTLSNILEKYPNESRKIIIKNNMEIFHCIHNFINEIIKINNIAYDSNLYAYDLFLTHLKDNKKDHKIFNSSKTKLLNNKIIFLYCFQISLNTIYLLWKSENEVKDAVKIALECITKIYKKMLNNEDFIGFYLDGFNPYFKINNKYLLKNIPKELKEIINKDINNHSKIKNKPYVRECRIVSFSLFLLLMKFQSLLINYEKSKYDKSTELKDRIPLIRKTFEPLMNLSKKEINFLVPNISKTKDSKNFEIMIEKEESRSKEFKDYNRNYYKYFSEKLKNKNNDMKSIEEELENKFIKEDNEQKQISINFLKTENNPNYIDPKVNIEKKEKIRKDSFSKYSNESETEEENNKNIKENKEIKVNINNNDKIKIKNDDKKRLDFEYVNYPILCTKRDLILKNFGYFYYKYYFKNKKFMKLKKLFFYLYNPKIKSNNYNGFQKTMKNKYPFIVKNFSNNVSYYPRIFFKPYLEFFDQKYCSISHPYFDSESYDKKHLDNKMHLEYGHGLLNQNNFDLYCLNKKGIILEDEFKKNDDESKILGLEAILDTIEKKENSDDIQKSLNFIDDSSLKKNTFTKAYNPTVPIKRKSKKNFTVNQNTFNNINNSSFSNKEDNINIILIECENISPKNVTNGFLAFGTNFLIYQVNTKFDKKRYTNNLYYLFASSENDLEQNEKQIIIPYQYISHILYRKFLFYDIAIEIFLFNGKSYYFNLYHIHNINKFTKAIKEKISKEKIVENSLEYFEKKKFSILWQEGVISTLDYLLLINKFSDRSYNVLSHYLILPWLLKNYDDKYNIDNLRNFSLPAFVKSREELDKIIKEEEWEDYNCHFPNLYSNYMYVTHFLFRIYPFINNQIKLQDDKFDEPGRQFHSIESTYSIFKENPQVNMELVPEFYFIPELFLNLNYCFFGEIFKKEKSFLINNLQIEPNFHFLLEIINFHQLNINSDFFNSQINKWIDYVFGDNQASDKKDNLNYFPYECYEFLVKGQINEEIQKIKVMNRNISRGEIDSQRIKENETQKKELISEMDKVYENIRNILNKSYFYGHCPSQLFSKSHPTSNKKIEPKIYNLSNLNNYQILLKNERITLENKDFLYIGESSKGNYFYVICEHEILVFNKNLKLINSLSIKYISKIPNFFSTKYQTDDNYYQQLYNYKYLIFDILDCKYFFIGGYMDNSLRIYTKEKEKEVMNSVYVETQIRCIRNSLYDQTFYTGHENGKIMKWQYNVNNDNNNNKINIIKKKSIRCHKSSVKMLELNEIYGCIISIDDDEIVFIRKIYDFELLSYIKFNKYRKKVIDINIYNQIIIFTITKIKTNEIFIYTYTLNGLNLGKILFQLKLPISLIPNTGEMIIFSISNIYCANVSFNEKATLVTISNNLKVPEFDLSLEEENDMAFKFNKDLHKYAAISYFYDSKNRVLFCLFSDGSLYRINLIKNV